MLNLTRGKTYVTDFATLADGRIVGLLNAGLLAGRIIVPDIEQFKEAHTPLIDRARNTLESLRKNRGLKVQVVRSLLDHDSLLKLARKNRARVITVDNDLTGSDAAPVTQLDRLFETLKPVYLPGAQLQVRIVKKGKQADEGIGYLEGGIKVVVDNGSGLVGRDVEVVVHGALDTAVGRVVFAKPKYSEVR